MEICYLYSKLKCLFGFHDWSERAEGVKCEVAKCKYHWCGLGWGDKRIKKIRYKQQSHRPYHGK